MLLTKNNHIFDLISVMTIVNKLIILVHTLQQTIFFKAISKHEISFMNMSGGRLIYNLRS